MSDRSRHPHHRAARATAIGTLLACALAASPAHADSLSAPRVVTPPGTVVDDFAIATSSAGGRAALMYTAQAGDSSGQRLLFARLGRGRDLGPARRLEERRGAGGTRRVTIFGSRLAVGADGAAVAAWIARGRQDGRDQLRVAVAPRGRGFGRARTLARAGHKEGHAPALAVAGVIAGMHGRAVVAWTDSTPDGSATRVAIRTRGRGFAQPRTLGAAGSAAAPQPSLALSPAGVVVAAWARTTADGARTSVAAATLRPGARAFGPARTISGTDDADGFSAFAGPGGAAIGWSAIPRSAGALTRLRMARVRAGGTIAAPQTFALVEDENRALAVDGLQLGFPLRGPVAAWQVFRDISEAGDGAKDRTRIDTMIGRGANVFHAPQTRSAPGALTGLPVLAALDDDVLLAWPERLTPGDGWHLRLAAHPAGGPWGATRTLADIDGRLAIAAGARSALVAWQPFEPRAEDREVLLAVYRP